eukprot:8223011-Pyramimonas_sp.AAC.2
MRALQELSRQCKPLTAELLKWQSPTARRGGADSRRTRCRIGGARAVARPEAVVAFCHLLWHHGRNAGYECV